MRAVASKRPVVALLGLITVFFAFELIYPRFPDIDDSFFKSAGRNFASGGAFAAPELTGFIRSDPPIERLYFAHPPIYTWLFGALCRVAGFSWRACVAYDALISCALAVVIFALARRVGPLAGVSERAAAAVAVAAAIVTILLRQPARPDELGMLFAYANLFVLLGSWSNPVSFALSGALAGLTLCTSVGVTLGFAPVIAMFLFLRLNRGGVAASLLAFGLAAAAAIVIALGPLYFSDPHFYRQFLTLAGLMQAIPASERLRENLLLVMHVAPPRVLVMLGTFPLLLAGGIVVARAQGYRELLAWYLAPFAGFLSVLWLRSAYTYWWFLQPWFLLTAFLALVRLWPRRRALSVVLASWLLFTLLAACVWPGKDWIARTSLPHDQQLEPATQRLRELVPPNTAVLTTIGWSALASDHRVFDAQFSRLADPTQIEFFVADGNGTGSPGRWRAPAHAPYIEMINSEFEVVADNLPRNRVTIFGHPISSSAYGFGTIVMRRRLTTADVNRER